MNNAETAWVAGLLEGEGSFGLGAEGSRTKAPKIRQIRITCGMTDLDTIQKLKNLTTIGNISKESRLDPRRSNSKPFWVWVATKRADVIPLLLAIRSHMGQRRGSKIDELLTYASENPLIYNIVKHGTRNEYRKGCKCAACMAAMRSYAKELRHKKKGINNE